MNKPRTYNQLLDVLYCRWMGHVPLEPQTDKFKTGGKEYKRNFIQCKRCAKMLGSLFHPNATEFFNAVAQKTLSEMSRQGMFA